jgi:small subunit ribosomal protein S1
VIFGRVKGGFTVDLSGAVAFLPGSQVDIRPVRDIGPLMGQAQPFQILKMDRSRGNIVVSRRAVLEETRAEQRSELIENLKEGQILDGVVKNITDYGAFVDLGGVDGLLHVTDIAWKRINHPAEALSIGQTIKVQVIRFNSETQRISLGMKQLEADPWSGVEGKYPVGTKFTGRVTNITDYGAFVELEPGVEGLVHVSEMSWTKKNIHPGKIVSTSQEVDVMVLDVDPNKRRISLGLKQCLSNPWTDFMANHPVGSTLEGEIKNITEFGMFVGLPGEIDGMVHLSDISWEMTGEEAVKSFKKGDMVTAKILDVDVDKERISLGLKQLTNDPFENATKGLKKGAVVTCVVTQVTDGGLEVSTAEAAPPASSARAICSRERSEQRVERFAVGEKLDAKIVQIDAKTASSRSRSSARDGRGKAGDGRVRFHRLRRVAGRHPGCGPAPGPGREGQFLIPERDRGHGKRRPLGRAFFFPGKGFPLRGLTLMPGAKSGSLGGTYRQDGLPSCPGAWVFALGSKGFGMHRGRTSASTEPSGIARYDKV